jgi:hypothetical protein
VVLDRVSQPKNLAIAFNFAAQSFRSVEGLASLSQYFETAAVLKRYSDMIRFQRDSPGAPRVRGAWEAVAARFELDGSFAIFELLMFCSIIA